MKYGFVKMISPENKEELFISVRDFERYKQYPIFKETAISLVIFTNIYIAGFSLINTIDQIKEYNEDALIINEISLKDICFKNNSISSVAKMLDKNIEL